MENISLKILKDLTELTEIENNDLKIKLAIFLRKVSEKINSSLNAIETRINEEIAFYGQHPEKYSEHINSILNIYNNEFEKIYGEYKLQYVNVIEELQEAYANQKIAIANCKKIKNLKDEFLESSNLEKNPDSLKDFDIKIKAFIEKAKSYETIIEKCDNKLEESQQNLIAELDVYVSKKTSQLVVYQTNNIISKIINKITNIFKGKQKVKINVLDKYKTEVNNLELDSNNTQNNIRENTINFIEQLLSFKEELRNKFDMAINV